MNFDPGSTIIILLMFALIALFVYQRQNKNASNETFAIIINDDKNKENIELQKPIITKKHHKHSRHSKYFKHSKHSKDSKHPKHHKKDKEDEEVEVNQEFIEMQYHKDYADTITGINNLTPQKELFNMGFLPVRQTTPNPENVKELVDLFISKLNNEIETNVEEYLHTNSGWNDMGKRRREKSGFEEQMEELGLPGSLYNEGAAKECVKLIRIDKAEQFNTEDQIRIAIHIIIQKPNVHDQMILKIQFFIEREDLKSGGDHSDKFFEKDINNQTNDIANQTAVIEQVFTVGYLTNQAEKKTKMDKFHDYSGIQRSDGTINQEKVIKMMVRKHKERADELKSFKSTLFDDNMRNLMDDLGQFEI